MASRKFNSVRKSLVQLWILTSPHQRRALSVLVVLTVIGAFAEVVTIGSVVPFLALLAAGSSSRHADWIDPVFAAFGASTRDRQLVAATILLGGAAFASAAVRLGLIRKTRDFTCDFGHRLSVELQRRMLLQPFQWHLRHNSSEQLAAIEKAEQVTNSVLLPLLQAAAAIILILVVVGALIWIAPVATGVAAVALGMLYVVLGTFARKRLESYAESAETAFGRRIRIIQEGLGSIRDLIIDGAQGRVIDQFRAVDWQLVRARADASFISSVPRFLIEPAAVLVIAALALILSRREGGLIDALPALGALALGAQRLLPLGQQLFQGWSSLAANGAVIEDVVGRAALPITPPAPAVAPLPFERTIEFRDVGYTYADRAHAAVEGLTFSISRGSRVALLGATGAGKTTTADLLMGLLQPAGGEILVDGVPLTDANRQSWRANVVHVPQMLFLADASVSRNIALSGEIDIDRVRQAVAMAQLEEFVAALPKGLETRVGERGAQLSGGQRQRLAIARAIYKSAPLLVFDEATSALDAATEKAVLRAIDGLQQQGRTIVIIAHRSSTTERCDQVLRLENGRLVEDSSARG